MKKALKTAFVVVAVLIIIVAGGVSYLKFALPNLAEAPEMTVEMTPERIERGAYLANHVAACMDCHSERDWTRFSGPPVEGTLGMGGEVFDPKAGFPGTYYAQNITPDGIGHYSDGELFRAITTGVTKQGTAMFPVMPYIYYGTMDPEDIKDIIAYLRSLKPIKNKVPASSSNFPMNFIINTIPREAEFTKRPAKTDVVAYGKYLANAAACVECHTQVDQGQLVAGMEFGGGRDFPMLDGSIVYSSNISSDAETGLGAWNEAAFVAVFRARAEAARQSQKLEPSELNSVMAWAMYGTMRDEDLKAMFAYLKTVEPVKNSVVSFTPTSKE